MTQVGQAIIPTLSGRTMFYPVLFTPPAQFDTLPMLDFFAEVTEAGQLKRDAKSMEAILDGGHIWFVHTDDYKVYRRTLEGDTLLIFSLPFHAMRVPETEIDSVIASSIGRPGPPMTRDDFMPFRRVVSKVLPDGAGRVYVFPQEEGIPEGTVVDVFEASGRYLGRMSFPAPVLVERPAPYILDGRIYAVEQDELGVPFVIRYRIVRPDAHD
jgi:hypothetical protein